ncbi:MAG: hypothetical protein QQN63_03360 [Nitrosopumilus sp.]
MPSHTKKERSKQPKTVKRPKKKVQQAKKPKRSMSMAERMGWTVNTQEIALRGNLQPTVDEITPICWMWES